MGNQPSSSPGAPVTRHRRDSEGPAHVPPGLTCPAPGARERRHSGQMRDRTSALDSASLASRLRKLSGSEGER